MDNGAVSNIGAVVAPGITGTPTPAGNADGLHSPECRISPLPLRAAPAAPCSPDAPQGIGVRISATQSLK